MKKIDMIGKKFGRWLIITEKEKNERGELIYQCKCECGTIKNLRGKDLRSGKTQSCGCLAREHSTTHGKRNTRLYGVWHHMKDRCLNPKNKSYYLYGGRGIKICDEWLNDFISFYNWALNNGYNEKAKKYVYEGYYGNELLNIIKRDN